VLVFSTTVVPASDPVVRVGRDTDEPVAAATLLTSGAPPPMPAAAATADGVPMLNVKIADFGVARYVGAAASAGAATFVGSPQYVAPEVLFAREHAGATYGRAVDV
jgi:serine/threonine protein kinase